MVPIKNHKSLANVLDAFSTEQNKKEKSASLQCTFFKLITVLNALKTWTIYTSGKGARTKLSSRPPLKFSYNKVG